MHVGLENVQRRDQKYTSTVTDLFWAVITFCIIFVEQLHNILTIIVSWNIPTCFFVFTSSSASFFITYAEGTKLIKEKFV